MWSLKGSSKYYSSSLMMVAGTTPVGNNMKLWNIESVLTNFKYLASSCLIDGTTKAGEITASSFKDFQYSRT